MSKPWQLKVLPEDTHPHVREYLEELRRIGPYVATTLKRAAEQIDTKAPQLSRFLSNERPATWRDVGQKLHRCAVKAVGADAVGISEAALHQLSRRAEEAIRNPGCVRCVAGAPPMICRRCGAELSATGPGAAEPAAVDDNAWVPVPPARGDRHAQSNRASPIASEFASLVADRHRHGDLEGTLALLVDGADAISPRDTAAAVDQLRAENYPDLANTLDVTYGRAQSPLRTIRFAYELLHNFGRTPDAEAVLRAALASLPGSG